MEAGGQPFKDGRIKGGSKHLKKPLYVYQWLLAICSAIVWASDFLDMLLGPYYCKWLKCQPSKGEAASDFCHFTAVTILTRRLKLMLEYNLIFLSLSHARALVDTRSTPWVGRERAIELCAGAPRKRSHNYRCAAFAEAETLSWIICSAPQGN